MGTKPLQRQRSDRRITVVFSSSKLGSPSGVRRAISFLFKEANEHAVSILSLLLLFIYFLISHFAPRVKIYFSRDEPIVIYKHDTERGNPPQKG